MPESDDTPFRQLVRKMDAESRLLRAWSLKGGISAQVTALEVEQPGNTARKMVVRQHGARDLQGNPHIAADEFRLLEVLQAAGLPAPKPYFLDESGEIFATPVIVVEFIEGEVEFAPVNLTRTIDTMAAALAKIHGVGAAAVPFLQEQAASYARKLRECPASLDESLDEGRIRDTLEAAGISPRLNASVLLHGDFWAGNLLWRDGELTGVVDWEDAAYGDPLADVGGARLEILWAFGMEAMQRFTVQYQALMPGIDYGSLPLWDLYAALRPAGRIGEWAGGAEREKIMREGHRRFVTQAFEKLSGR